MPLLEISTNTKVDNELSITEKASALCTQMLGKPESYVMVKIQTEQTIIFAGNNEPAAHVKLKSLGLPEDKTTDFSASICAFISEQFDIDSARIYIEFANPERHMWGWNEKTF